MQHFLPDNPRLRQTAIILLLLAATFVQAKLTMTSVATHSHALPLGTVEASVIESAPYHSAWAARYAVPVLLVGLKTIAGIETVFAAQFLLLFFLFAANLGLYRLVGLYSASNEWRFGALLMYTFLYSALLHPYFALWDAAEIALWYWTFHALKQGKQSVAVLLAIVGMLNRESGVLQLMYVIAVILVARHERRGGTARYKELILAGLGCAIISAVYLFLLAHFRELAGEVLTFAPNEGVLLSGNEIWIWTNIKKMLKVHRYFDGTQMIVVVMYVIALLTLTIHALRSVDWNNRLLGSLIGSWLLLNFAFGMIDQSRVWLASVPAVVLISVRMTNRWCKNRTPVANE